MNWGIAAVGAYLLFRLGRFLWRAYVHPAHVLMRQAANMDWTYSRFIRDEGGYKNSCVARDGMEAMITYINARVVLLKPARPEPFADFIELERWLERSSAGAGPVLPPASHSSANDAVSEAIKALHEIETSREVPGIEFVRAKVLALLADREKTTFSVVEEGLAPKVLVYLLITNVAWEELQTGQHHVYRGVLSLGGQQILVAFMAASKKMVESGRQTQQEHERELATLRGLIKGAG